MPRMDGMQALEKLQELGCKQPIYALTANAMSHEIAQYLAIGFAGHLKKPIEREVFLATISQYYPEINDSPVHIQSNADISDLIVSFVNHLSQDKQDVLQYSDTGDNESLVRTTHKIAGAAKMFGFAELSQSAFELECAIKKGDICIIDDLTHCLLDEISLIQRKNKMDTN